MGIAIAAEHLELAQSVRRFLAQHCTPDVVRVGLESDTEELPAFWKEAAALGWLGIHVPEEMGGQGFGLLEAAIVLEEVGRACAPGPFLPTLAAAAVVARAGRGEDASEVLRSISAGAPAALAFSRAGALAGSEAGPGGEIEVSGVVRPVLGGAAAEWFVLPADRAGGTVWCVIAASDLSVRELPSLDPTRRCVEVEAGGVQVPEGRQLRITGSEVESVVAALVAAESAGGASWCVETAASYAKVREQFGRPIGQFQAVKHRCSDMLVAQEQAQAVAWAAATSSGKPPDGSGGGAGPERLPAAVAGALAPEAFARTAKDCIQVLGGVGFTWEHDAHLYLRRAVTLRQLMGGPSGWHREIARMALSGTRHSLSVDLPSGSEDLRERVRAEAEAIAALPAGERRRALVEAGLFVPHWSPPWGRDAGAVDQLVIDEELKRAGLRRAHLAVGAWAAPTIAVHGTPEQQERWVRPTLLGEITWCQLFSEPGAGSDLASLRTRATRAEGGWVINGQKVWTSLAAQADWGICLARTNPSAAKHLGITYFVVDMSTAGIDIRPLREMTGNAMFNEVFLDDVFVPDDCVVGEVDGGWSLARTTLANERVAMGSGSSFGGGIEALLALASGIELDETTQAGLGALIAEAHSVAVLGQRSTERAVSGAAPGSESSVRKLLAAEHDQRTQEFGLSLLGSEGAVTEGAGAQWAFGFLANRCLTIAGGTSEVQRNVIAERILGLPRDPDPSA